MTSINSGSNISVTNNKGIMDNPQQCQSLANGVGNKKINITHKDTYIYHGDISFTVPMYYTPEDIDLRDNLITVYNGLQEGFYLSKGNTLIQLKIVKKLVFLSLLPTAHVVNALSFKHTVHPGLTHRIFGHFNSYKIKLLLNHQLAN